MVDISICETADESLHSHWLTRDDIHSRHARFIYKYKYVVVVDDGNIGAVRCCTSDSLLGQQFRFLKRCEVVFRMMLFQQRIMLAKKLLARGVDSNNHGL